MRRLLWCALLMPALASAEIYRWTDAQGRVHFGQRPQAADAERVDVRPQVMERDAATREREARSERFFRARQEEQQQQREEQAERQRQRLHACQQMRRELVRISQPGLFFRTDQQGERQFYSDAQMAKARQQLQARVAEQCGD